jgi:hypothetical protein
MHNENSSTTQAEHVYDVFGVVFNEGESQPTFKGTTKLHLTTFGRLKSALKKSFPEARKISMTVLGTPTDMLPAWFRQIQGHIYFPKSRAVRFTPPTPPKVEETPKVIRKNYEVSLKKPISAAKAEEPKRRKRSSKKPAKKAAKRSTIKQKVKVKPKARKTTKVKARVAKRSRR